MHLKFTVNWASCVFSAKSGNPISMHFPLCHTQASLAILWAFAYARASACYAFSCFHCLANPKVWLLSPLSQSLPLPLPFSHLCPSPSVFCSLLQREHPPELVQDGGCGGWVLGDFTADTWLWSQSGFQSSVAHTPCLTSGKSVHRSKPQFSHLRLGSQSLTEFS